jgi:succinoglycan biosynthesis transport protein ExoP
MKMAEQTQVRDLAPYPGTITVAAPGVDPESEERALPLSHYVWVLKRHRWKILTFVTACLVSTYLVTKRLTPLYEAATTIDIDRQAPRSLIGDPTTAQAINSPLDADQFLATQVSLIKSDSVLRPVVERLRLREAEPAYAARVRTPQQQNAPIILPGLEITRPPNTYLLLIKYRSRDPQLAADVANAIADSYLEHSFQIRIESSEKLGTYMTNQLEQLRAKMEASSQRLADFERELNVINPDQKTSIQSASLLQLNTDYNTAKEERVRKEAAYNAMKSGSIDAAYASTQSDSLKKLAENLADARQHFAQAKLHYGENHPEYRRAQALVAEAENQLNETKDSIVERVAIEYRQALDREDMLQKQVEVTRAEYDRLNAHSFDYQALKGEADSDKNLYNELIRKIREAGIASTIQDSSVRIADRARTPARPVFPRTLLNLAIALVCSSLLAFSAAIVSDLVDTTIRDPEQVTRTLRTEVVGTLPAVRSLKGRLTPFFAHEKSLELLPAQDALNGREKEKAMSGYEEAVRTLRNSILLTDFDRRLRSVLVTSASPAEGKSTVAAHLAAAHAEQRHRTLLIDGDLRRPSAHKFFNVPGTTGLSNILSGSLPWREAVLQAEQFTDLHLIAAGPPSRRAADLIGRALPDIIEEAASEYDLVILDSPPLIGFPEPLQMAANVDGVLVVTRAGRTNRKAVASVLGILSRLRANVVGIVLNEVTREMSDSYYYYGYYTRYYRADANKS